jgi:serine/threonine protein kinase
MGWDLARMTEPEQVFDTLHRKAKKTFGSFVSHFMVFDGRESCETFLKNISFFAGTLRQPLFPSNMIGTILDIPDGGPALFLFGHFSISQNMEILGQGQGAAVELITTTHTPDKTQEQSYHPVWIHNLHEAKRRIDGGLAMHKRGPAAATSVAAQRGLCPNCEHTRGQVGEPCSASACAARGYHLVPETSLLRHIEWSAARGFPPDASLGLLVDRYHLVEKLGHGGSGPVYLAFRLPSMRRVVLRLLVGCTLTGEKLAAFNAAAQGVASLYHPALVHLVDFGVDTRSNAPYLVWDYVADGITLEEMMRERGLRPWPEDEIREIMVQVLDGLLMAHENGYQHGGISPASIIIAPLSQDKDSARILDCGLRSILQPLPGYEERIGMPSIIAGARYSAPEQVLGTGEVDSRADLYAVGALIFEMLTRVKPCPGNGVWDVFFHKVMYDFDPLSGVPPDSLSEGWLGFFRRALAPERKKRFMTASEMKQELLSFGEPGRFTDFDFPEVQAGGAEEGEAGSSGFVHVLRPPDPTEAGASGKRPKLIPVDSTLFRFDGSQASFVVPLKEKPREPSAGEAPGTRAKAPGAKGGTPPGEA